MFDREILLHAFRLMCTSAAMTDTYEAHRQVCKYVHATSRGHEAIQLATAFQMLPCDYISPYYRDDSMLLGLGFSPYTLMLQLLAKADDIFMEYPKNMNVGDNLKNASMHMDVDNNGMKQSIDMDVFDRKVEAKENVTTPAGSWDCFKISYKSKLKIKTMGIGMPMNIEGIEYFAPGFGVVKTQSKSGGTEIVSIK